MADVKISNLPSGVPSASTITIGVTGGVTQKYTLSQIASAITPELNLFNGTWTSLQGKPTFATVATSGAFADLSGKPTTIAGYGITDAVQRNSPGTITGDITMAGSIIPDVNITRDLGSPTKMWKDIYVGPGSIYMNGKKILEDVSSAGGKSTIVFGTDINQNLRIETAGTGNLELAADPSGAIMVKGALQITSGKKILDSAGVQIEFSDNIEMSGNRVTGLAAPFSANHAATKSYVDGLTSSDSTIVRTAGNQTIDGDKTFTGTTVIAGNLTVSGTTTTINAETVTIADNIIALNSDFTSGTPTEDSGFEIRRGDAGIVRFIWDETNDRFTMRDGVGTYLPLYTTANITAGTFSGNVTGNLTGNASTASAWQTARALTFTGAATGTASVNGSADVSIGLTLADVNNEVGNIGSATAIPILTLNAKGLVTGATTAALSTTNIGEGAKLFFTDARARAAVSLTAGSSGATYNPATGVLDLSSLSPAAAAGTLTGTALASNVVSSSLTSVGTLDALFVTGAVTAGSFSGNGSLITALNAANLTTGVIDTARLGSGTTDASTYLRGDGTWAAPTIAASTVTGTALATNVVSSSLTSVGTLGSLVVTGTVTAGNLKGDGSQVTALNASNLGSGTAPAARLGSGTANASTYLRGDGTWSTISAAGWADITSKPAVIAAGATAADARTAIGAGTSNLVIGTTAGTAMAGDAVLFPEAPSDGKTYGRKDAAWAEVVGTVTSVAGKTGPVVLAKGDVGLSAVDNTSDAAKPVSTAQQTALNLKANLASPEFTGHVIAISSPESVGISALAGGNSGFEARAQGSGVDSGAATLSFHRPGRYAVHFGLDTDNKLKVGGWSLGAYAHAIYHENNKPTKADVGLSAVDNTSDANKPVSTATQTALNAKLSDAPSDGKTYGRKDGAWAESLKLGTTADTALAGDTEYGYRNIPQNSQSAAYTLTINDAGKHILHPAADAAARTYTIPSNADVAYSIGTAITFINQNGTDGVVSIAINADTMRLAGAGTTGTRTLARNGIATAIKITATEWIISGSGLV